MNSYKINKLVDCAIVVCTNEDIKNLEKNLKNLQGMISNLKLSNFFRLFVILNKHKLSDYEYRYLECDMGEIKILHCPNVGLSFARNHAIFNINSAYIWFIDDEIIIPKKALITLKNKLENNSNRFLILGGPVLPIFSDLHIPKWFNTSLETRDYSKRNIKNVSFSGGNQCVNRDLALGLSGYNENLGMRGNRIKLGEDRDFFERAKFYFGEDHYKRYFYSQKLTVFNLIEPRKLKFSYRLKREIANGELRNLIRHDIKRRSRLIGDDSKSKSLFFSLAKIILKPFFKLRTGFMLKYPNSSNRLQVLATMILYIFFLSSSLYHFIKLSFVRKTFWSFE